MGGGGTTGGATTSSTSPASSWRGGRSPISTRTRCAASPIRSRAKIKSGVVVLASANDGKVQIVVAVTPDLTTRVKAGQIVKELAPIVGGGGGGRPDFAEAGGKQPEKIDEMLARQPRPSSPGCWGRRAPPVPRPQPPGPGPTLQPSAPPTDKLTKQSSTATALVKLLILRKILVVSGLTACALLRAVPARRPDLHLARRERPHGHFRPRRGTGCARVFSVPKAEDPVRATRFVAPEKSALYDPMIREHAENFGVRTDLVRAVVQVESGYNAYARSPKGALGSHAAHAGDDSAVRRAEPVQPDGEHPRRRVVPASAARSVFERRSARAGRLQRRAWRVDRHGVAIPPYKETRDYVSKINRMAGQSTKVPGTNIYKTTEVVDGREVPRYSDHKPSEGGYRSSSAIMGIKKARTAVIVALGPARTLYSPAPPRQKSSRS